MSLHTYYFRVICYYINHVFLIQHTSYMRYITGPYAGQNGLDIIYYYNVIYAVLFGGTSWSLGDSISGVAITQNTKIHFILLEQAQRQTLDVIFLNRKRRRRFS